MTAITMTTAERARPITYSEPTASEIPAVAKSSLSSFDGSERLLRMAQVTAMLGISRATIYRYVASGKMPKPIKLSARCVAWKASVISDWLASLQT